MGWWPLYIKRRRTAVKHVNAPLDEVVRALHDSLGIINLNPLVAQAEQDEADPTFWRIKDNLQFLGVKFQNEYTVKFKQLDDGYESEARAGLGTVLTGSTRARAVSGGTEVTEDVTIESLFLVMPFILANFKPSHDEMHTRLAQKIEDGRQ